MRKLIEFNQPFRQAFLDLSPYLAPGIPYRECVDRVATNCFTRGVDFAVLANSNDSVRGALRGIVDACLTNYVFIKAGRQADEGNPTIIESLQTSERKKAFTAVEAQVGHPQRTRRILIVIGLSFHWTPAGLVPEDHPIAPLLHQFAEFQPAAGAA